jgi:hypothetical protein
VKTLREGGKFLTKEVEAIASLRRNFAGSRQFAEDQRLTLYGLLEASYFHDWQSDPSSGSIQLWDGRLQRCSENVSCTGGQYTLLCR